MRQKKTTPHCSTRKIFIEGIPNNMPGIPPASYLSCLSDRIGLRPRSRNNSCTKRLSSKSGNTKKSHCCREIELLYRRALVCKCKRFVFPQELCYKSLRCRQVLCIISVEFRILRIGFVELCCAAQYSRFFPWINYAVDVWIFSVVYKQQHLWSR